MKKDLFITNFLEEFEDVNINEITIESEFRDFDEWDSMTAMMIIAMIDEKYNVIIEPEELKLSNTIGELFDLILSKKTAN